MPITSHPINECWNEKLIQSSILGEDSAANTKHETQGLGQSDLAWLGLEGTEVQIVSEQEYVFSLCNRKDSLLTILHLGVVCAEFEVGAVLPRIDRKSVV